MATRSVGVSPDASRYGVIDVGSNTVHLLVADCDGTHLRSVHDESRRLQLGKEVALHGCLATDKIEAAAGAVAEFVSVAEQHNAQAIRVLGTQAVRSAQNRNELLDCFNAFVEQPIQVLDPRTEAHLGYLGTTLDRALPGPYLTIDIGGGSTQLLLVDAAGTSHFVHTLPVGSVGLPVRFWQNDPPSPWEHARAVESVRGAINASNGHSGRYAVAPELGVLIGGVGRRLLKAGRLKSGDRMVHSWVERLTRTTMSVTSEAMEVLGAAAAAEADMVRAGAAILHQVMTAFSLDHCVVSDKGIREGAVLTLARGQEVGNPDTGN